MLAYCAAFVKRQKVVVAAEADSVTAGKRRIESCVRLIMAYPWGSADPRFWGPRLLLRSWKSCQDQNGGL